MFQKNNKFIWDFLKLWKRENDMSVFARDRAVKLFDIDSWIKRHKEVFEIFK